jgi:hypothetical protein
MRTQRLSEQQLSGFRQDGYVRFLDPVFPPKEFEDLRLHFEEKLRRLPADVRPENMDVPHFTDLGLFRWLLADDVLDLVEPILGPDIALFTSHFVCKPGGDGRRVPWHTDAKYWREVVSPMEVCTVWLAIDPSTVKNGCMVVIPGSHKLEESDYEAVDATVNVFQTEIVSFGRDEAAAVSLELEPNQASLHDGRIQHSSAANTSPMRRCGLTMRYISTRTRFDPSANDYFKHHRIYLARGRDHTGNADGDPTRTYEEAAKYRELRSTGGH